MRKVLLGIALLGLFGISNVIASEEKEMDTSVEMASVAEAYVHGVNYWVTDMHMDHSAGGPYYSFTVHWEYIGNHPNPDIIAYIVYVYDGTSLVTSYQDSAPFGSKVGSKVHRIKVDRDVYYRIEINGSDGSPF